MSVTYHKVSSKWQEVLGSFPRPFCLLTELRNIRIPGFWLCASPMPGCSARPREEMHVVLDAPYPPNQSPAQLGERAWAFQPHLMRLLALVDIFPWKLHPKLQPSDSLQDPEPILQLNSPFTSFISAPLRPRPPTLQAQATQHHTIVLKASRWRPWPQSLWQEP